MSGQTPKSSSTDSKKSKSPQTSIRSEGQSGHSLSPVSVTTNQPTGVELPQSLHGLDGYTAPVCTPELENLIVVDQLLIRQRIDLFEVITGCERSNRYSIQNVLEQQIFEAKEVSGFCDRYCCGPVRPFDMQIFDFYKREAIYFRRPLRCTSCICFCCLQEIEVESPRGNILGYVIQDCSLCYPVFHIENSLRQTILRIEGPLITSSCCCNDVVFDVLAPNQDLKVANISKLWSGCVREAFTDYDNFRVTFPQDLDVNMKAMILSAAFLIDYIYFEVAK